MYLKAQVPITDTMNYLTYSWLKPWHFNCLVKERTKAQRANVIFPKSMAGMWSKTDSNPYLYDYRFAAFIQFHTENTL